MASPLLLAAEDVFCTRTHFASKRHGRHPSSTPHLCNRRLGQSLEKTSARTLKPHAAAPHARVEQQAEAGAEPEVFIRRSPPRGISVQPCGPMSFQVPDEEDNKPQNILEEIIWWKAQEVRDMREKMPLIRLQAMLRLVGKPRDFIGALKDAAQRTGKPGLIAEVKKASPSKGVIQPDFDPVRIAQAYEDGGAACLSVLTDRKYFQGSFENLQLIRQAGVQLPLLCKEFVVEAYQLYRARAFGADAVLLIAAVLPNSDLTYLIKSARALGLQVLLEVHCVAELERVMKVPLEGVMLGINNRDLRSFKVDLGNNRTIMESAAGQEAQRQGILVAGESGIFTPEDVAFVASTGCQAILVGESLVKQGDPAAGVRALLGL